jgi:hypothetical protein
MRCNATRSSHFNNPYTPYALLFFEHFIPGSGTPISEPAPSALSSAVRGSAAFQALNTAVQQKAKELLAAGDLDVGIDPPGPAHARTSARPVRIST